MMNVLAVLVSTLLLAAPGKPPSPEEQRLFDQGMRAFQAGNAREADKAWRAGYAVAKDPAFLVRMGEAEEKAGQPTEAADSYHRYLRAAPDAADRAEIEQRLARLEPAGAPAPTPVGAPGSAATSAPQDVQDVHQDAHEVPGAFGDAGPAASAPFSADAAGGPPRRGVAGAPAHDDETGHGAASDEELSRWNSLNLTAWIATGATVVLLGVSGYLAASAGSSKDDVNLLLRYQDPATGAPLEYHTVAARYESAVRKGQRDDRLAKATLIAAAGTTVVATVFFILDAVRNPEQQPVDAQGQARGQARRQARRQAREPGLNLSLGPDSSGGGRGGVAAGVAASLALRWAF